MNSLGIAHGDRAAHCLRGLVGLDHRLQARGVDELDVTAVDHEAAGAVSQEPLGLFAQLGGVDGVDLSVDVDHTEVADHSRADVHVPPGG